MKRIAILMVFALLANVEPALAQGARGGSFAASSGRSVAGYTGGSVAGYTGASTARHGGQPGTYHRPGGHAGHHHRPPHHLGVVVPWWWWHLHYGHRYRSTTVVVPAPVYVPVYPSIPAYPPTPANADLLYYCPDHRDFYPNVATCPSQWLQVVPPAVTNTNY
jgi:hypothetical protein